MNRVRSSGAGLQCFSHSHSISYLIPLQRHAGRCNCFTLIAAKRRKRTQEGRTFQEWWCHQENWLVVRQLLLDISSTYLNLRVVCSVTRRLAPATVCTCCICVLVCCHVLDRRQTVPREGRKVIQEGCSSVNTSSVSSPPNFMSPQVSA